MKAVKVNNLKKKTDQNSLNTISIVYTYNTACLRKTFMDDYYLSGYFSRTGTMG